MIAELLAVVVVMMAAWGISALVNVRFADALPLAVFGIVFALYLTYIVGALHAGWWLVVALSVIGGGYAGLQLRRSSAGWRACLPSPQVAAFLLATVLVLYFTKGQTVQAHDELRLWGAYPKLLFLRGGLEVGPDSMLGMQRTSLATGLGEMQTYTPGMPLFGYFVEAFGRTFVDDRLHFAYGLFCLAILMPMTRGLTWRQPIWLVPAAAATVLLPTTFADGVGVGDFYAALFVDTVVGVGLGYALWLLAADDAKRTVWSGQIGLALGALYLVKTSTLGLSAIILAVAAVRWVLTTRRDSLRRRLLGAGLLTGPLLVSAGTWVLIQAHLGPGSKFDDVGTRWDPTLLDDYASMLLRQPLLASGVGMFNDRTTFIFLNFVLVMAIACLALMHVGRRRRHIVTSLATLIVVQVAFLVGIYLLVIGPFGGEFASFPRYTATLLTVASVLLALLLASDGIRSTTTVAKLAAVVMSVCLIFAVLNFPLRKPVGVPSAWGVWSPYAQMDVDQLRAALADSDLPEDHPAALLLFRDDALNKVWTHHAVYYDLLDTGARIDMQLPATLTPPTSPTYTADVAEARRVFLDYLHDHDTQLVQIAEPNPELESQFGDFFDKPPTFHTLFRVEDLTDDSVKLRAVS